MVQYDRIIIILLAVIITVPVILKSRPSRQVAASAAFSVTSTSRGHVRVSGDVRHPGVYPISANMLTIDAIKMAEPLNPATGLILQDREKFVVGNGTAIKVLMKPGSGSELFFGSMSTAHRIVLGIPVDINAMTADDFERIPGIGPVLAKRIIEYRQINGGKLEVKDLILIDGIGEKKYLGLKKYCNKL